jgi:hypothetical protein
MGEARRRAIFRFLFEAGGGRHGAVVERRRNSAA